MSSPNELPQAPTSEVVAEARRAISLAKRDIGGFIEGEQPNITEPQFTWLSYRMSFSNDEDAMDALLNDWETQHEDIPVPITLSRLETWRRDPNFTAFELVALGNKREGTRLLLVHQAGKALRAMSRLLDHPDPKIQLRAVTLWSRQMGLLLDKLTLVDKDDLTRLAERLMAPVQITPHPGPSIIEGEYRETVIEKAHFNPESDS